MLSKEDVVVVASPTLFETGPEPLPRLEEAGTIDASQAEDGARAIGPVGASGSAAQPPTLTLKWLAQAPYSSCPPKGRP